MVQKHYGCSAADGMELEYERWKTQASSHWNYRVAKDDLMSSRYKHGGAMYYTALTMSVFDDLEYYSANWGMEEPMTWGNKSDCYLLDNNYNDEFVKKYPGMFCVPGAPFSCTSDRTGVGYCDPNAFYTDHDREESRALYIRYEKGTLSHSATRMCNENRSLTLSGSVFADDSLCLDTDVYKTNGKENISYTGVCARVSCDKGKVKVMYAGISEWKECPENKSLEVDRGDSDTPITLKCPKYSEVCTIAPDGSSRLPLVIPPGEKPATPPGTEGNGSNGGGADVGNGNQGGNNNVDNGNQGVDGCIVPAFLAPVLLLVTVLALLLHQ
ncbi:Peptidase M8 [Trypanosoma melophagium]|uniref:Peptidase M8 n=1 Tax=Trypanosoma melophagium TaxID=715481 RepID=UPI00351A11CC|nr:Peptidase M8 [Trypanosoma melophagium]